MKNIKEEIKEILFRVSGKNPSNFPNIDDQDVFCGMIEKATDQILSIISSKLPKERENPDDYYTLTGYNQCLKEIKALTKPLNQS